MGYYSDVAIAWKFNTKENAELFIDDVTSQAKRAIFLFQEDWSWIVDAMRQDNFVVIFDEKEIKYYEEFKEIAWIEILVNKWKSASGCTGYRKVIVGEERGDIVIEEDGDCDDLFEYVDAECTTYVAPKRYTKEELHVIDEELCAMYDFFDADNEVAQAIIKYAHNHKSEIMEELKK